MPRARPKDRAGLPFRAPATVSRPCSSGRTAAPARRGRRTILVVTAPARRHSGGLPREPALTGSMLTWLAFAALTIVAWWWLAGRTGAMPHAGAAASFTFIAEAPWAVLWLASALGLGVAVRRGLLPESSDGSTIDGALGVAVLLVVDTVFARSGLLGIGGVWTGLLVLAPGWGFLAGEVRRRRLRPREPGSGWGSAWGPGGPPRVLLVAAPAAAVLLLAACSAPGWLWGTEFGGYDALSYHLQLPKEWHQLGRLQGLDHNVYAHLPSFIEAAYLHLFTLRGGRLEAVFACQFLHALFALLTATTVAGLGRRLAGPLAGAAAGVIVLATPWVTVAGSLAYDEMAVTLLLAGAVAVVLDENVRQAPRRRGVALGLLVGAACGAKLTSVGFVAAPVVLLVMLARPARRALVTTAVIAGSGLLVLSPWAIANTLETGNPVFPFGTTILGAGHWTSEQASIWSQAHGSDLGILARLREAFDQLLSDGLVRAGPRRVPQWSILPVLTALVAIVSGLVRPRGVTWKLVLVLGVQTLFWIGFTHVKARFMLPAVVPAALLTAIGLADVVDVIRAPGLRRGAVALLAALLLVYGAVPILVFATEQGGRPAAAIGALPVFNGDADAARLTTPNLTPAERRAMVAEAVPAWWINHHLDQGSRVLAVGEATPLHYRGDRVRYQTTWDRGPMSAAIAAAPGEPAAWIATLRAAGFTHLLVNETMLRLWESEGWNDPDLTADPVLAAADTHATLLRRWPDGLALHAIGPGVD